MFKIHGECVELSCIKKAEVAKKKAWTSFLNRFPKAEKSRFISQATIDEKNNVTAEVFFKESEDSFQSVFGSDKKYWSAKMKEALGFGDSGGFPYELAPLGSKISLPILAVPFDGKAQSLKKYSTPQSKYTSRLTNISQRNCEKYFKTPNSGTRWQSNKNAGWEGQT